MTAIVGAQSFNGNGHDDLIARDASGNLWLYPGTGGYTFEHPVRIGVGWNGMTAIVGAGDFNGDGHSDLIARDRAGSLWLYPGTGTGGFKSPVRIGIGWASMTAIVGGGDFNGDSHPDLIARDAAGNLWMYPGTGSGFGRRTLLGTGWAHFTMLSGLGDTAAAIPGYTTRGNLLAREPTGVMDDYQAAGAGSGLYTIGTFGDGWNSMTALTSVNNILP
jgi:FG-GAP-like repeat